MARLFRWSLRGRQQSAAPQASGDTPSAWERHTANLHKHGIPIPGNADDAEHPSATRADEQRLYDVKPSFVDLLPWVEYLPDSQSLLLDDGESVAAFFELKPIGTEGREAEWLIQARDALENALQDSFDELDDQPWVVQLYVQDETDWSDYLNTLRDYIQPRAQGSAFSAYYQRFLAHHLRAITCAPSPNRVACSTTAPSPACHGEANPGACAW
tara:strand:- start:1420 stop:2061 length:642 start_codon:yes stop_codon:yes gene_type:complete